MLFINLIILVVSSSLIAEDRSSEICESPAFNGLALMQHENHLVNLVKKQIEKDDRLIHAGEQTAAYNRRQLAQGGDQSDTIPIPAEYIHALERRDLRSDDCLNEAIRVQINDRINANCYGEGVDTACSHAQSVVDERLQMARQRLAEATSMENPEGAIRFAKNRIELLSRYREEVRAANSQCVEQIQAWTGNNCQTTFDQIFTDQGLMELFAKTCTPNGVRKQIHALTEDLNFPGTAPTMMQSFAVMHIKNREKENALAEEVSRLADFVNQMAEREMARQPASENEEN
jgi:hypothetical protein